MLKFIIIIIILGLLAGVFYFLYQQKQEKFSLYDLPVLFSAYAHSIDGLSVVPLCQDPEKIVEETKVSKAIPDDFFQKSVAAKEELYILGSKETRTLTGDPYQFYLVRTKTEKFGYIPIYRLEEKDGKPFASLPTKGPVF